ncbi:MULTISPECIES: 1-phosphofructokinase family hexose kinase [Bacteria]|uniref:1-phosphofructokinase family hexose kinase n=1 Tax=Bacteria TaxID=2 RepID=UPI003C7B43B2
MIVTVTPNPAVDLTWRVDRLVPGGTHRADAGRSRAGGKGLNVARVAHAQGAAVHAITTAGGATGDEVRRELRDSGVPHTVIPVEAPTRRSVALVDESLGDATIVNERGIAPTASEWRELHAAVGAALTAAVSRGAQPVGPVASAGRAVQAALAEAASARPVLVVAGSVPPGSPDDTIEAFVAQGRAAGAVVIADTSGPALLRAAEAGASVLKPNAAELAEATGIDRPVDGARELLRRGAGLVLLSLGSAGMLAVSAEGIVGARLAEPLAGNPTGAGDAAVAACAVLRAEGEDDPETIIRRATAWSAAAVLMPLAGEVHASWPALEAAVLIERKEQR